MKEKCFDIAFTEEEVKEFLDLMDMEPKNNRQLPHMFPMIACKFAQELYIWSSPPILRKQNCIMYETMYVNHIYHVKIYVTNPIKKRHIMYAQQIIKIYDEEKCLFEGESDLIWNNIGSL